MSKYLVTGLGGSGKSTVCESLRSRGVNVFDSNNVPGLASWRNAYTDKPIKVDPSGYVDWSKVAWDWDESVLKKLLVDNENLILCGSASNQMRFHRLFDRIFVLALDRKTHRRHLEGRSSPYGKDFKTMAELLDEQQEFAKNLISHGAIAIDASGTPEQTAEQILEHISMKAEEWLKRATNNLRAKNIGSARLDSLILLEDELGWDRAWVLAHPEAEIKPEQVKKLNKKITRRASYEPLAYIRGFSEFYGRKFKVNKRVLEPRP